MNNELTEQNIKDAWNRIVASIADRGASNAFNPPASDEQISTLESKLGMSLPYSLSAFLRCQNGCKDYSDQLIVGTPFFSTSGIEQEWSCNCEVDEGRPDSENIELSELWWHKRCIPIAGSDGDCVCIDSKTNTIYSHNHGMGGLKGPNFPSLVEWLASLADRLESGQGEIEDGKLTTEHW